MTTGEIVVMGLFLILGLNAAVYALRLFFLLPTETDRPCSQGVHWVLAPGAFW